MPRIPSINTLGRDRLRIISLTAELHKYVARNTEGFNICRYILNGSYAEAFDACVDLFVRPPNSVWHRMLPLDRVHLLLNPIFRDALRLDDLIPWPEMARRFVRSKQMVRRHMPELFFMDYTRIS